MVTVYTVLFAALPSPAQPPGNPCTNLVSPLERQRDDVDSVGGIWALFQRSPALRSHSSEAIQLDSKINKIILTLKYLCDTRDGVPLNELARYVTESLAEKGKTTFSKELIIQGKPEAEIKRWFEYTRYAQTITARKLDFERVKKTITDSKSYLRKYQDLSRELEEKDSANPVLQETVTLSRDIDQFLANDAYMSLAINENSRIPFWDVDENYGGS
ncbi:MAG: hypothetical protein ACE5E9_07140 [Nitrospinaceae bacterium]